jgi:predicted phosphohydrolase
MKLWIMSDLHQEFPELAWRPPRVPEHDILVLAGDIDVTCAKAIQYARSITDKPIVMVAGNHEFYGQNLSEQLTLAQALSGGRLHFLENQTANVDGVRFVGATLWTDFELFVDFRRELTRDWAVFPLRSDPCLNPPLLADCRGHWSDRHGVTERYPALASAG